MRGFNHAWHTRAMLAAVFGLAAALLSLAPYVPLLEEKIGLGLLFALRGGLAPPTEVVIVNIDRESARRLSAPPNPEQWPHRLHAEAIRRLHAAGAELVGFNVFFSTPQPGDDAELAAAMRESGSVVLANYLRLKPLQGDVFVESLDEPAGVLGQSALATAPFLLAQGEEADRFVTRYGESGDHPTFPVALLRLHVMKKQAEELGHLLADSGMATTVRPAGNLPPFAQTAFFAELESAFEQQPATKTQCLKQLAEKALPPGHLPPLRSLIETLAGDNTRYFNHYGPASGIAHIPYHRLFAPLNEAETASLRGKIVLVGFGEDFQPEIPLFSPFSAVSSLELAATALANLLGHNDIHPLFNRLGQFTWLLLWGGMIGLLSTRRLLAGAASIALFSLAYFAAAGWLFSARSLWLPVLLPLFLLAPLGMLGCLFNNYLTRSRENKQIHSVIDRFIPEEAARRTSENWQTRLSFGVCLFTDAGRYTALAETMRPMDLGELMDAYYAALFPCVRSNGGWVSDVIGDAMMAVWSVSSPGTDIRVAALRAALDILRAVDAFETQHQVKLPIRMGLHCGEIRIGFVGNQAHSAYRAVGDTVNTASRLEGLNKLLGTRILVSEAMVADLPGFATRPMGRFLPAGKTQRVAVHELIAPAAAIGAEFAERIERFSAALAQFQAADWERAAAAFAALAQEFPEDGPSQFYCETAKSNANNPQAIRDPTAIPVSKPPPGALAAP